MMAKLTFVLEDDALKAEPQKMAFSLDGGQAQAIYAMLLGTAAKITRERTVQAPDPLDPDKTVDVVERYEDDRTLGECLRDEVSTFMFGVSLRAKQYAGERAAVAARSKALSETSVDPVEVAAD
jgi:hypothetical protein